MVTTLKQWQRTGAMFLSLVYKTLSKIYFTFVPYCTYMYMYEPYCMDMYIHQHNWIIHATHSQPTSVYDNSPPSPVHVCVLTVLPTPYCATDHQL